MMSAAEVFWTQKFIPWLTGLLPILLRIVVVILLVVILTKQLPKILDRIWKKAGGDAAVKSYVRTILQIVLWLVALIIILELVGVPTGSLLAMVAAVGAAVALAIKDNLANLASGVVLLFTKPFKAGDYIEVDGMSGTVQEIELMRTYLDTPTNTRACIPNMKVVSSTVVNYSAHDFRRQDLLYSVAYEADLARARDVILTVAEQNSMVSSVPEKPVVVIREYGDSGVILMLRFWCAGADYYAVQFSLNEQVKQALDRAGIGIPYPHLEIVGLRREK